MRPTNLGEAYFFYNEKIFHIYPERNHKDWLLKNEKNLPAYVRYLESKALFESYQLGYLRLVWDSVGEWQVGKMANQGSTLYINGIEKNIWLNIKSVTNFYLWCGLIDNLVIEYLDIVKGKPSWKRCLILKGEDIEPLYKGKKPYRNILPSGTYFFDRQEYI